MKLNLSPCGEIVVFHILEPGKTKGGLSVPEGLIRWQRCYVLAVGPDVKHVKVGDRIIPDPQADWKLALENPGDIVNFNYQPQNICFVREKELVAIIKELDNVEDVFDGEGI